MNCRWKDKDGNNRYESFIPEAGLTSTAQAAEVSGPQPGEKRRRHARRPTNVLCITTTVAMYMSGSPTFLVFTSKTRW